MTMTGTKKGKGIVLGLCVGGLLLYFLWSRGAFLPGWIRWEDGTIRDRTGCYEIVLRHRQVRVLSGDTILWTSPQGVRVQAVLSWDIDNDSADELLLLCWKRGRYGKYKPFWVKEDEKGWSQHLFVYEYEKEEIVPKWMSSYLGEDVAGIAGNGKEAPFSRLLMTDRKGGISSWVWGNWGFSREKTDIQFVVFGDNILHEPIYRYGLEQGENFDFLFENMRDTLKNADIAVINQETPLTDDPSLYGDYPRFGTPVQAGQAIVDAGFDVVTCATNHALDRGVEGIDFTKAFFTDNNVLCLGIRSGQEEQRAYETMMRNGICFGLLNYTYGTNGIKPPEERPDIVHLLGDEAQVREEIARAKAETDFVIVFVHWGTEYAGQPDAFQEKWAEIFLDCGVDVVVGAHPHVLQPCEMMTSEDGHQMLIFYSIGNFVSAQEKKICIKGGMAEFTVSLTADGYRVTKAALRPLGISWEHGGKYTADFIRCIPEIWRFPAEGR